MILSLRLFGFSPRNDAADVPSRRRLRLFSEAKTEISLSHPDWPMVDRVQRGDVSALDELVREYFTPLARFAVHITGSYDAAEDVVQGLFFRVWERRVDWMPVAGIRAYLFASARNAALNARKSSEAAARRGERFAREIGTEIGAESVPLDTDENERDRERLRDALSSLTERQQLVLRLRYEQQLSAREIAAVLNVSVRAVERMIARGVTALRDALVP